MVLIGHGMYSLPDAVKPLVKVFSNGQLGVLIFFVLSGFLIHQLTVAEIARTGGFSWKGFYQRRIFRIFPAFYTYVLVVCIVVYSGLLTISGGVILTAATFTQNYGHFWWAPAAVSDYHVIGHYWTLALEEQFYVTWPVLVFLMRRRWLLESLLGVVLLAPILRVLTYVFIPDSRGQIGMMFHTGFDAIAIGVLLGEVLRRPKLADRLLKLGMSSSVLIVSVLFLLFLSPYLTARFHGSYGLTIGKTAQMVAVCLIVIHAVYRQAGPLFMLLNWKPLVWVGVLSYSLYVWNNMFLYSDGDWLLNVFPYNYLSVVSMGVISYYFIESPFLKLKVRIQARRVTVPRETPVLEEGV